MADPTLPPDFKKQCQECFEFINGPYDGQNPGHMVRHAVGEPENPTFYEHEDAEHPLNVSHGVCDKPACQEQFENRYRGWIEQRKAEKAAEQAAQQQEGEPEA